MTMTGEHGALGVTTLELTGDTEVRITRVVAAPKGLVFDVHTKPEHLPKWMLGPPGWTMPVCEIDLRPGGAFRYVWLSGDGAELTIAGTFHEVIRPDRLVSTETWSDGDWPETRNTLTFTEHAGRTTITTLIRYPSPEARDTAVQSGMKEGMDAGYTGLEAYLSTVEPAITFDMRLELIPVPVSDIDAAIAFYEGKLGFHVDHDIQPGGGARVTQLTPPGSACSIAFLKGLPGNDLPAGSLRGLHLVVADAHKSREILLSRGVEAGPVDDMGGILYVPFSDPDGNTWLLQEIPPGASRPTDD